MLNKSLYTSEKVEPEKRPFGKGWKSNKIYQLPTLGSMLVFAGVNPTMEQG